MVELSLSYLVGGAFQLVDGSGNTAGNRQGNSDPQEDGADTQPAAIQKAE